MSAQEVEAWVHTLHNTGRRADGTANSAVPPLTAQALLRHEVAL